MNKIIVLYYDNNNFIVHIFNVTCKKYMHVLCAGHQLELCQSALTVCEISIQFHLLLLICFLRYVIIEETGCNVLSECSSI